MKVAKKIYEKITGRKAPYYYDYSIFKIMSKPLRKYVTNTLAANCPFNCVRVALYKLCGFKIGKHVFIGMKCYLDDMCYNLLTIGNNVTISYGVFFACHGKNQEHLPITVDEGAYIGMRASIISKNAENLGWGYISTPMQRLGRAHWLTGTFQKVQRLLEYHAESFILQTVQV